MGLICKISGHKWNGCRCERCREIRDEQHDWNGSKCDRCGKMRDKLYDYESKDFHKRINAISQINSTDILFSLATTGKYEDIVELSAIKLAKLGDKRVITHFDDIVRHGRIGRTGSLAINMFLNEIIKLAFNIPCEETVVFLEKHYKWRDSYTAFIAQQSLLAIKEKVQNTPLANQIAGINLIDIPVPYGAY